MRFPSLVGAAFLALLTAFPAFAADDSVTAKNAAGTTITFCGKDVGAGVMASCAALVNTSGTKIDPATSTLQSTANTSLSSIVTNTGLGSTAANQSSVIGTKAAGTAATNSLLTGGVYTAAGITLTTGQQAALQFDSTGHLLTSSSATAALQGAQGTGATYDPPTGGSGEIGYLSGIYAAAQNGAVADGAADSGVSSKIGGKCATSAPAIETAADRVPMLFDCLGKPIVMPYALPSSLVSGLTAAMTGTTSTAVTGVGAPGSGLFNYITTIACGNSHATVGTFVELQDGSGGTTFFTVPAAAVYGGAIVSLVAPLKQPTANTALYVKDTTTGANVVCSVAGFKAP